jgi:hypothetical protein
MKGDPEPEDLCQRADTEPRNGHWTIFLVHRVNGANGEFLRVHPGRDRDEYFEDFYKAISLGEGSTIALSGWMENCWRAFRN